MRLVDALLAVPSIQKQARAKVSDAMAAPYEKVLQKAREESRQELSKN